MKIVLIGPAYPIRGGNALFVAHLYESLAATNDVQVISYSRYIQDFCSPAFVKQISAAIALKEHPAAHIIDCLNPFTWWKAARLAASMNPDILVFTWWNPFFGIIVEPSHQHSSGAQRTGCYHRQKMLSRTKADGSMSSYKDCIADATDFLSFKSC